MMRKVPKDKVVTMDNIDADVEFMFMRGVSRERGRAESTAGSHLYIGILIQPRIELANQAVRTAP